ncbi:unnamed protein product (macronuclear) [Paramecium tetraurelia]|uniref:PX domain-containing protein n=1 Tax=Paramecium tetraurelia TaxID=5888 RepID=A0CB03_PARTE|nr:uncharacterized protein GSPATT00036753001 [Paramecium tetraurelia]CAK67970.1 unnamed protein product [Paramecium tetraurelia]|eukprot:XP_001435367.1 hypothetical protein (macronuclear) [Paramecium tetraurelia strain d4-2]
MDYYEAQLEEKEQMLQKAAQVIESLKLDFENLLIQYQKSEAEKTQIKASFSNWDQMQQFEQLKLLLTQEVINFHPEQFKTPFTQFNYKNELELSLQREAKFKDFLLSMNENVKLLIDAYSKCIDEPITQGIQQILFEFEIWDKCQEQNSVLQLQIAEHQILTYTKQISTHQEMSNIYNQLIEYDQQKELSNQECFQNQQLQQILNAIQENTQVTQKMALKIAEQQAKIKENAQEIVELKKQIEELQLLNQQINNQKEELQQTFNQSKQQQSKLQQQAIEYLQMIDEYERIFNSEKVDGEEYNKVTELFEQSLIDLENLQTKYEKKELQAIDLQQQLKCKQLQFDNTLKEIKELLDKYQLQKQESILHKIYQICNKGKSNCQNVPPNQLLLQLSKSLQKRSATPQNAQKIIN